MNIRYIFIKTLLLSQYQAWEISSWVVALGSPRESQSNKGYCLVLGCFPKAEYKSLLLKTPHILDPQLHELKLCLTWNLSLRNSFHSMERCYPSCQGRKRSIIPHSSDAYEPKIQPEKQDAPKGVICALSTEQSTTV